MLGALCTRKGPDIYVACREEILKNVSDNLERKLPDSEELTGGLMHKLTGGENDTSQETVRIKRLRMLVIDLSSVTLSLYIYMYIYVVQSSQVSRIERETHANKFNLTLSR